MAKKIELDKFHYHEALDRSHVIVDMMNDYLLEHPAVSQNKKIKKKVEKAIENLADAYQLIGQKSDDRFEKN